MRPAALLAAVAAAAAVLAALPPRAPLLPARVMHRARTGVGRVQGAALADLRTARLACVVGGAVLGLTIGGLVGVVAGLGLALAGPRGLARLEPRAVGAARRQLLADLPLALDLLAACLVGGATLTRAVAAVAEALPGPLGERLDRVAAALAVGSPPEEAWAALTAGIDRRDDLLIPVARTLVRAAQGGAPVVGVLGRLAQDARAARRAQGEQAARRAGVLAVVPLGLCFLPAFVLLGVVPIVAGLVGPLLASF